MVDLNKNVLDQLSGELCLKAESSDSLSYLIFLFDLLTERELPFGRLFLELDSTNENNTDKLKKIFREVSNKVQFSDSKTTEIEKEIVIPFVVYSPTWTRDSNGNIVFHDFKSLFNPFNTTSWGALIKTRPLIPALINKLRNENFEITFDSKNIDLSSALNWDPKTQRVCGMVKLPDER